MLSMFSALRLELAAIDAAVDQIRAALRDRDAELAILDATDVANAAPDPHAARRQPARPQAARRPGRRARRRQGALRRAPRRARRPLGLRATRAQRCGTSTIRAGRGELADECGHARTTRSAPQHAVAQLASCSPIHRRFARCTRAPRRSSSPGRETSRGRPAARRATGDALPGDSAAADRVEALVRSRAVPATPASERARSVPRRPRGALAARIRAQACRGRGRRSWPRHRGSDDGSPTRDLLAVAAPGSQRGDAQSRRDGDLTGSARRPRWRRRPRRQPRARGVDREQPGAARSGTDVAPREQRRETASPRRADETPTPP